MDNLIITLAIVLPLVLGAYSGLSGAYDERMQAINLSTRNVLIETQGQRTLFASGLRTALKLPADAITTEPLQ